MALSSYTGYDLIQYHPGLLRTWRASCLFNCLAMEDLEAVGESRVRWMTLALTSWSQLGLDQLSTASAMRKLLPHWKNPLRTISVMTINSPKVPQAIKLLTYI